MQALLELRSLHDATPMEQYTPGMSSGFGFISPIGPCAMLIDIPLISPFPPLIPAFIFIIFSILGREHALSACTEQVPHMHFIMTSLFNGTFPSFFPNILKITSAKHYFYAYSILELSIKKYVTARLQQQNKQLLRNAWCSCNPRVLIIINTRQFFAGEQ